MLILLPSILFGLLFALALGGKPGRVLDVHLRYSWTVLVALVIQAVIFTPLGAGISPLQVPLLHLFSNALLIAFAVTNLRPRSLTPVWLGLTLNVTAICANGGSMPVSSSATSTIDLADTGHSPISEGTRLGFLGDIFALPSQLPLANVFSVGDLLIGIGMVIFIVVVSLGEGGERQLDPRRILAPLRFSPYRRLAGGRLVSHLGDWLTLAALIGWIYDATGSTGQVALTMLVRLAPPILGGGLASVIVDRLPKQRLLVGVELARGLTVAGALAGVLTDQRPLIFLTLGLSGALAAVSGAAVPALLPSLLPHDQLSSGNACLLIAKDGAMALGAVGAGLALSWAGAAQALALDLVTFGVAALLFVRLGDLPAVAHASPRPKGAPGGLRYLLGRRRLVILAIVFATATLATGLTNATLPRFMGGDMNLGAGGYGFGIAALAGGLCLGQAVVGFAHVGPAAGRWIGSALVLMSGLFALFALAEHVPTALLLLGAIGFVDGTTDVLFDTIVQREADPRYLGSVFGLASAFMTTTMMGAVSVAPVLNKVLDSRHVILGAGVFLIAAGAVALHGMRDSHSAAPVAAASG